MYEFTIYLTKVLATFTLLGHISIALFLIYIALKKWTNLNITFIENILDWIKKDSVLFTFLIALIGTSLSLFYSELAGYPPCELCWYQRIFLYPQVIIYARALKTKDNTILNYGLWLTLVGWLIAGYQYILQMNQIFGSTIKLIAPCTTDGSGPSCSDYYFFEYGYITMPLMSFTAFTMILMIILINKYYTRQ